MSLMTVIGVGLVGGLGAVARVLVDTGISARLRGSFPAGILAVNLAGCLALGVFAGLTVDLEATRLVATGLLGSFTTFSTWMYDTRRLASRGATGIAATNLGLSLLAGLLLAWIGTEIGAAV